MTTPVMTRANRRVGKALTTLRARVIMVVAAASIPLLLAVSLGFTQWPVVVCAVLGGVLCAMAGIDRVVARPLDRMSQAIDAWREGGRFDSGPRGDLPPELRALALSFKRATRMLARREAQLRTAVSQQELAMQEIHHRVKNNLQIVASMLNLQSSRIRLPAAKAEFQSARDRVRALATLHRHLYAHGEVHTINMRLFLQELCGQLFSAFNEREGERLVLEIDAPELEMSSDQGVPLSLIVTEAVSNSIKYAYPAGRRGTIAIRLRQLGDDVELSIADDGVGISEGRTETDAGVRDGIGIQLINGFARQLGATLQVERGAGTRYLVRLKLRRERMDSPALGAARPRS